MRKVCVCECVRGGGEVWTEMVVEGDGSFWKRKTSKLNPSWVGRQQEMADLCVSIYSFNKYSLKKPSKFSALRRINSDNQLRVNERK